MQEVARSSQAVRFGVYEADLRAGELRKNGLRVKLQDQPFQILAMLLARPGDVVTREELREKLWPGDTFVDFDKALNTAVNKIREALGETADNPRFVETLPRRGYRFIAPVEGMARETEGVPHTAQQAGVDTPPLLRSARKKMGLGFAVLALVIGGAIWYYVSRPKLPPMITVPLTTFSGREVQPSLSPNGNQVAFKWDGGGDNDDIYIQLIGGGRPLRLTTDPADDAYPTWSPDGRRIAFMRNISETESAIFTVPALGGTERKLHSVTWSSNIGNRPLSWSPDGKHLAFISPRPNDDRGSVHLLSLETLETQPLTSLPTTSYRETLPVFSPDGKTVAFVRNEATRNTGDIHVVPSAGGEPKRLTFDGRDITGLTWSADGSGIIFSLYPSGQWGLWSIPASGGDPERLPVGEDGIQPSISHQVHRLVYARSSIQDQDIWRVELPGPKGETGTPTKIIDSTRFDHGPHFSPNGKRIAFDSHRSGKGEIWVCDSNGSNPMPLTSLGGVGYPRWSPDGRWIAFHQRTPDGSDISVVSSDGGPARRLIGKGTNEESPSWSRDGKWVYFTSNRSGNWQIWKMPAEGGKGVQITKQGGVTPIESPDGKFVYYAKGRSIAGLWKVPVDGGEEEQVLDFPKPRYYHNWTVVEDGVFYVNPDSESIEFFSFATRRRKRIIGGEGPTGSYGSLSVSPEGRWLIYNLMEQRGADLMLVENFRVE